MIYPSHRMHFKTFALTLALRATLFSSYFIKAQGQETSTRWTFPPIPTNWPTGFTWPNLPTDWTLPTALPTLPPPPEDAVVDAGILGKIQGAYSFTSKPRAETGREQYYWFSGIPYAKPESYTDNNRFKSSEVHEGPLEPKNAEGIYNGVQPFVWCPQSKLIDINTMNLTEVIGAYNSKLRNRTRGIFPGGEGYMGQEDCLIVSVSTPNIQHIGEPELNATALLPVIVFIHGGGFNQFWGSVFGGHRLLNRDVVLVTLNYRLGILGSLNLGINDAPGSAMVYDCITALDWVQKYIHHFGGDKERVTISGQSAGAVLSTSVFLSPLAKGKFHGAIGDSGSAYSIWATNLTPMDDHLKIIGFTSCKTLIGSPGSTEAINLQELRECMRNLEIGELVAAAESYSVAENLEGRMGYDALVPSVQSPSVTKRCIEESPASVLRKSQQSNVPLMMGVTRHDGSFVFDTTYHDYLVPMNLVNNSSFIKNDLINVFLKGVGFEDPTGALYHSLQRTYLGDAINTNDFESKIPGLLDIHTVLGFKAGGYGLVEKHAALNKNSYYYAFDYKGMFSTYALATQLNNTIPGGVAHVDDLIYLFQLFPLISKEDEAVALRYVDIWVNFATYGNPNGPSGEEPFPPFSAENHRFLIINETDSVGYHCRNTWIGNSLELIRPKP